LSSADVEEKNSKHFLPPSTVLIDDKQHHPILRMSDSTLLTPSGSSDSFTCKVSSVLNRDAKQFGKKHLFDGDEETCWNSDQGSPQFVIIAFPSPKRIEEVRIRFQGGFVGGDCAFQASIDGSDFATISQFYPDDSNKLQSFPIDSEKNCEATKFRILFGSSTDFFGRITIYTMELFGR